MKIGQSSHKIYSNNILIFQESTTILNVHTKKNLETYRMHLVHTFFLFISLFICLWKYSFSLNTFSTHLICLTAEYIAVITVIPSELLKKYFLKL